MKCSVQSAEIFGRQPQKHSHASEGLTTKAILEIGRELILWHGARVSATNLKPQRSADLKSGAPKTTKVGSDHFAATALKGSKSRGGELIIYRTARERGETLRAARAEPELGQVMNPTCLSICRGGSFLPSGRGRRDASVAHDRGCLSHGRARGASRHVRSGETLNSHSGRANHQPRRVFRAGITLGSNRRSRRRQRDYDVHASDE